MPLVQDRLLDLLTSSPARYHCALDATYCTNRLTSYTGYIDNLYIQFFSHCRNSKIVKVYCARIVVVADDVVVVVVVVVVTSSILESNLFNTQ